MWRLIFLPFVIQAVAIGLDEVLFHRKRGLPRWERIGHPIDTLSVAACVFYILLTAYSPAHLKIYIGLAVFSCLMVTKDEFVHKHHCPGAEHWLHALLFLNHPVLLTVMGLMWPKMHGQEGVAGVRIPDELHLFMLGLGLSTLLFALYQIIYWNFLWKSTTPSTTSSEKSG